MGERWSHLLNDYHAGLLHTFKERQVWTRDEVLEVLNNRFQVLLLTALDIERGEREHNKRRSDKS